MKLKRKFALIPMAAALMGFGSIAQAGWTASFDDLVNNVSGTLSDTGFSGGAQHYTLVLDTSAYSGGAAYLDSVDFKAFDSVQQLHLQRIRGQLYGSRRHQRDQQRAGLRNHRLPRPRRRLRLH